MTQFQAFSSNHPVRAAQEDVQEICNPLFNKYYFNYFHYAKIYKNGTSAILYNRLDWSDHFYAKGFRVSLPLPAEHIVYGKTYLSLWQGLVNEEILTEARTYFDLNYPFGITIAYPDYIESFSFTIPHDHPLGINAYFLHQAQLIEFTSNFIEKAAPLIRLMEKHRLVLPDRIKPTSLSLLETTNRNIKMLGNYGEVDITLKELSTLQKLASGLNAREAAQALNRSPRTIESHVYSLKNKLGIQKQATLIQLARQQEII